MLDVLWFALLAGGVAYLALGVGRLARVARVAVGVLFLVGAFGRGLL